MLLSFPERVSFAIYMLTRNPVNMEVMTDDQAWKALNRIMSSPGRGE